MPEKERYRRSWSADLPLVVVALAAVLVGIYVRFKGLGSWPLDVDEYYSARAAQYILRSGLPEYACGGYYERGLLFHYLGALLASTGVTFELALRLIAVVSSLLALPAAYLLARRADGTTVAWLVVTMLALSMWEIEMARFGRMYTPFQAAFLWYAVFFERYALTGDRAAFWTMLGLSIAGFLLWEGGVLLAFANFLPLVLRSPDGHWSRSEWGRIALLGAIAAAMYASLNVGWRIINQPPPWSATLDAAMAAAFAARNPLLPVTSAWSALLAHPFWLVAALAPLAAWVLALRWMWSLRARWVCAAGLAVVMLAALLHQFLAAAGVLLLLLMVRALKFRELIGREARSFHVALALSLVFWLVFGLATGVWQLGPEDAWLGNSALVGVIYHLIAFPNVLLEVIRPWSNSLPVLGVLLILLVGTAIVRDISERNDGVTTRRALQVLFVALLLAASATKPPRHETRYVFFLYPIALVLAFSVVANAVRMFKVQPRAAVLVTTLLVLGGFAMTEDLRIRRMLAIDTATVNFRLGETEGEKAHYLPRADVRGAADWLWQHADVRRDVTINAFPSVDFYYPRFDYAYIDWRSTRFPGYACRGATRERWGNLPLLYTREAIEAQVAPKEHVYLVIGTDEGDLLVPQLARWNPQVVWRSVDGHVTIVALAATRTGKAGST